MQYSNLVLRLIYTDFTVRLSDKLKYFVSEKQNVKNILLKSKARRERIHLENVLCIVKIKQMFLNLEKYNITINENIQ